MATNESWLRKILVIDDELARGEQGRVFSSTYPLEGFEYCFAADRSDAQRLFDSGEEFALVLLDVRFEGLGDQHGLSILEWLSGWPSMPPVAILSSVARGETILRAWHGGADAYLVKWSENPHFYEELQEVANKLSRGSGAYREAKRAQIGKRTRSLLVRHSGLGLDDIIGEARALREELNLDWRNPIPFADNHENYVRGWNATETELRSASANGELLFLNLDFGTGCTLNCPHCFTVEGAIDRRGRQFMPYSLLKERILEAKTLGLRAVRILGRGEPTQWVARGRSLEDTGGDIVDFLRFLAREEIIPVVFTRGQLIGHDPAVQRFYGGHDGMERGEDLVRLLADCGASVFLGISSIFPDVNNEMVGRGEQGDYDRWCRRALSLCVSAGLTSSNPTRLAVESPITTLNIAEMPVRYLLFQLLNISPCMNTYMVTGRMQALGLGELTDPSQEQFLDMYAAIHHFMRRLGIRDGLGPYAGTKECHDVSHGLYLTLNGDVYPCPGYESAQNFLGSVRRNTIREIWENNPLGRRPQSICPPKIATHFPPTFQREVLELLDRQAARYDQMFETICEGLGVPRDGRA